MKKKYKVIKDFFYNSQQFKAGEVIEFEALENTGIFYRGFVEECGCKTTEITDTVDSNVEKEMSNCDLDLEAKKIINNVNAIQKKKKK